MHPTMKCALLLLLWLNSVTLGFQSLRPSRRGSALRRSFGLDSLLSTSTESDAASANESVDDLAVSEPSSHYAEKPSENVSPQMLSEVDYKAYANGYKTVFSELPFEECKASVGSIPKDLKGSYFRSGPAMFSAGSIPPPKTSIIQPRDGPPVPDGQNPKRMVQHPFEADGGVLGVTFPGDGTAAARYRYVRTVAFTNERRKGQRLYRGMDSTRELGYEIGQGLGNDIHNPLFKHHLQPGLNRNRKNTSNTRSVYWGKRLLSLWEGGQPYKLDALALSTEGKSLLGGVLEEEDPFGSKMVIDPVKDRALMYRVIQDAKSSQITVFEFNNMFRLVEEGEKDSEGEATLEVPGLALLTDMAVTTNYALFVQPAVSVGMQFVFAKEPGKIVKVEKEPSTLHLIPRVGSGKQPMSIEIPLDESIEGNLEFVNAYEEGDTLVFDAIRSDGEKRVPSASAGQWPWASSKESYIQKSSKRSLWRYEVDLKRKTVKKEKLLNVQCYYAGVAPSFSTVKHDKIFLTIGGRGDDISPPQGIATFSCSSKSIDSWLPEPYQFCGEPMFAPKAGSSTSGNDGYILSVMYDGKTETSVLLIFEATSISAGPVCRIPLGLPHGIPHGLHGCFTDSDEATWSLEEIQRRAKLADKMESRGNLWNEVKSDFSGLGLRFDDMEEYFGDSFLS